MANSKVQDLNPMKSPQQRQKTNASQSPGASDAQAADQHAKIPQREHDGKGGQHGSNSHGKNGSAQHK